MAVVNETCAPPPSISAFRVVAAGERFARVQWTPRATRRSNRHFHFEVDWSQPSGSEAARLILPSGSRTALLSELEDDAAYSVRIRTKSDCDGAERFGPPVALNFTTRSQETHPSLRRAMPHEIVLTALVLFVWLMILRHFIRKYNKMTFVSPHTAYVGNRRYSDTKTNPDDVESVRRGSELSARSKASTRVDRVDKFELLENVVSKWRSEAVLEGGRTIHPHDVASVVDRNTDAHSSMSADTCKMHLLSPPGRRISNVTITTNRTLPASVHVSKDRPNGRSVSPVIIPTVRVSQSFPLFRKMGSSSVLNHPARPPTSIFEDYEDSIEAPPCSPSKPEDELDVSDSELEQCRLLAKLSGPSSNTDFLQPDGMIKRKISEVLLGKATHDIRRCSTLSAYLRRPKAPKHALVRRRSFFQSSLDSFRSVRKSLRLKRPPKSAPAGSSKPVIFGLPPIDSRESTPRIRQPPLRQQHSFDTTTSYFTCADVSIQIADADQPTPS
ncbi:hypothetical protein M3Y99_01317100 [Aphelenchoides fujianensis]|nr:hypothetical protein M3Y99_01317100 [Aphelenchoides fujianensis]